MRYACECYANQNLQNAACKALACESESDMDKGEKINKKKDSGLLTSHRWKRAVIAAL